MGKMSAPEWVANADRSKYKTPAAMVHACKRATGVHIRTAQRAVYAATSDGRKHPTPTSTRRAIKGAENVVESIRASDPKNLIAQAIGDFGPEELAKDAVFFRHVVENYGPITKTTWRKLRSDPAFRDNQYRKANVLIRWGHKNAVKKKREEDYRYMH